MIIVLKPRITKRQENSVLREIRKLGYEPHVMRGVARTVVGAIGDEKKNPSLEKLTTWPRCPPGARRRIPRIQRSMLNPRSP